MNARHVTLALAVASSLVSLPASALVTRAFVSGGGSDANTAVNCSLTQPCRTFQNAMTVLTDGGEVIALDSAGYGTVNITKSVSLIAPTGIFAGLTPTTGGSSGITIATASVIVNLRGITINNQGGTNGITMTNGAALNINGVVINGFAGGYGLNVQTPARVNITNTQVLNSSTGMAFGSGATVTVTNSSVQEISSDGIMINGGSSGTTKVTVSNTSVSGNGGGFCFDNYASSGNVGQLILIGVVATNCYVGIEHEPLAASTAHLTSVSSSNVSGSAYGLANPRIATYGTFYSAGNNQVMGNTIATSGTITTGGLQ